jgi:hypothetical protein
MNRKMMINVTTFLNNNNNNNNNTLFYQVTFHQFIVIKLFCFVLFMTFYYF